MRSPRLLILGGLAAFILAACAATDPTPSTVTPSVATPPGASQTVTPSAGAIPSFDASPTVEPISDTPPPLAMQTVGEDFAAPIGLAPAPGGWLIVNEQGGRAVALDPSNGETATTLDISDRTASGGERGLLGLVLHPDWPNDDRAFVHYSGSDGGTVLSEFHGSQADGAPPTLDPGSEVVLLTQAQPFGNHNGGQLAFGPDGQLWMALGDGGSGGDPLGSGQDPTTLLGSILRLDVSTAGAYAIPDDNPFADGREGAREVYLFGLRNPWRFSFDAATGLLWIADVGQGAHEEVNRLDPGDAGANLGWNTMEGAHCFQARDCSTDGLVLPVAEYGRDVGCSVTGGHVYRGPAIDGLRGWYLMADYCSGRLMGVRSDTDASSVAAPLVLLETDARVSAIGADNRGELYVADLATGRISRIVPGG